jgi:arabinogalactan endo-1,4-beta-galactosidase
MKKYWLLIFMIPLIAGCHKTPVHQVEEADSFIRGADLSFLPQLEADQAAFFDTTGRNKSALQIFKENGCNTVRIRLWHTPDDLHSSLTEVNTFAQRVRDAGMKVWLDLHYSDTWADPGKQYKPADWTTLSLARLKDSVFTYTKKAVLKVHPDYVQIGNEINNGFLWETGRITHETQFTDLLKQGIKAVREVDTSIRIMIHYAGYQGAFHFFGLLKKHDVDYDWMGISYYPWWHGRDMTALRDSLSQLTSTYQKGLVIAETAYPFTLKWYDWTHNIVGDTSQLIPQFPATVEGQKNFLLHLRTIIENLPRGIGFCYWAPDWISVNGPQSTAGSPWENLALFDFQHHSLPAMSVYKK